MFKILEKLSKTTKRKLTKPKSKKVRTKNEGYIDNYTTDHIIDDNYIVNKNSPIDNAIAMLHEDVRLMIQNNGVNRWKFGSGDLELDLKNDIKIRVTDVLSDKRRYTIKHKKTILAGNSMM